MRDWSTQPTLSLRMPSARSLHVIRCAGAPLTSQWRCGRLGSHFLGRSWLASRLAHRGFVACAFQALSPTGLSIFHRISQPGSFAPTCRTSHTSRPWLSCDASSRCAPMPTPMAWHPSRRITHGYVTLSRRGTHRADRRCCGRG
jgi:hypothetical protein